MKNKNYSQFEIHIFPRVIKCIFYLLLIWGMVYHSAALPKNKVELSDKDTLMAYIGIIINPGNEERIAKTNDRIEVGENLQILIESLNDCFLYILHECSEGVTILNSQTLKSKQTYILPQENYYAFDGNEKKEKIVILVSLEEKDSILKLIDTKSTIEINSLLSQIRESSGLVKPERKLDRIEIGGNVRTFISSEKIKLYAGESSIVKEYIFNVKK